MGQSNSLIESEIEMKVTQEKLPASQISLEIEIPAETSKQTYEKVVKNLARSASIPGFRKGKAPRQILMQRIGLEKIKAATIEEVLQTSLDAAMKQEKIQPIGNYQVKPSFEELVKNYEPGQILTFKVAVDVPPTFELAEYRHLNVKAEEVHYDEQAVEKYLEEKRAEQATFVPVEDRPAALQDIVTIDYQGYKLTETQEKGEPIAELKGVDSKIELIEGTLISGMIEGLIGMKPEEVKEIIVTFPADYPEKELAGVQVLFTLSLKEIKTKELPELDDEFAEEISEHQTLEELKNDLTDSFQKKAQAETKDNIHQAIVEELLKTTELELPETYVDKEIQNILTQTAMQMEQYGLDVRTLFTQDNLPKMRENARPDAIKRLKQTLILEEIATTEGIEVDPEALSIKVEEVKKQLSGRQIDLERLKEVLEEELRTEKTLNWLQESAQLELLPPGSLTPQEEEIIDVEAIYEQEATEGIIDVEGKPDLEVPETREQE